jgi:N-glycosylase/DNA lyase
MVSKDNTAGFRIEELMDLYGPVKTQIENRLGEFRRIWAEGSDEDLFRELVFCLLTPQSRARTCWAAVERLVEKCLTFRGTAEEIQKELVGVRFSERKAEYICLARKMFSSQSLRATLEGFSSPFTAREWLVQNVKGLGYKEASHYLRNIGLGEDLAILDRHILKNLLLLGVIEDVPASLSKKTYLDIEKKMTAFSKEVGIPMGHLDLLLWYKEAGEVFK